MSQSIAARSRSCLMTRSVASDTAVPAEKVTRLPPVVALKPMVLVSPTCALTLR